MCKGSGNQIFKGDKFCKHIHVTWQIWISLLTMVRGPAFSLPQSANGRNEGKRVVGCLFFESLFPHQTERTLRKDLKSL